MNTLRSACLAIPAATLLVAAVIHLRDMDRFQAILVTQRVLPYRTTKVASRVLPISELAVGLAGVSAAIFMLAGSRPIAHLAAPQTILLWAFACYISVLLVRGRPVPCGCFGGSRQVTVLTLVRGVALAGTSLAGLSL